MSREKHLASLREAVAALGPWFHNIDLGGGVMTAPEHFLGDYPAVKWRRFSDAIPADLSGRTVLDIGCNAGFHSLQMKARGAARVLGIDADPDYLRQARFAADTIGVEIEFAEMSVYDVAALREQFDIVLFLGVLYHLRHPLLALDLIREHVVRDLFVCQSMQRGDPREEPLEKDYPFSLDCRLSNMAIRATLPTGGCRTGRAPQRCCAAPVFGSRRTRRKRCSCAA
jgi:tRNA (mo5U34)-methyltransferase